MTRDSEWIRRLALTEHVTSDLACCHCGYNLKTLRRDGKCPECGIDVQLSLRGDLLQYSDPAWLEDLTRGLRLMVLVVKAFLGSMLAFLILTGVLSFTRFDPRHHWLLSGVTMSALALLAIGWAVGLLWFTRPEPNYLGMRSLSFVQRFIRASAVATVAACVVASYSTTQPVPLPWLTSLAVGAIASSCGLAVLIYIRRLAQRIPDDRESGVAQSLLIGLIIGLGLMALAPAGALLSSRDEFFVYAPLCGGCVNFVMVLAYAALLFRFHRLMETVVLDAQDAQRTARSKRGMDSSVDGPTAGQSIP